MAKREVGDNLNRDTDLRKERHQEGPSCIRQSIHPDKLPEEEKKEVKFHWAWDYFTLKGDVWAICNICKRIFYSKTVSNLTQHLKRIHKIFGPSPDSAINNESSLQSDANRDISLKKEKHLESPSNSSNLSNYQLQECTEETGTLNDDASDNVIPVRCWIRGHYTKTNINEATCNHCNDQYLIDIRHLNILYVHLREIHPDKLTEKEKKEVKFHWVWDYFTLKDDVRATCNICKKIMYCENISNLTRHLKILHKIFGPSPDSAINNESSL
ncbi:PREDICTED: uncharacterized protein LOC105149213 [Acromyrmex echinatior]|uniref:uncharacterized protein LOC105149213 n=1 Tax=Acromyrmex echinatior TaxID=103372 RepID=UPI000580DB10|nr:PREDICTED: uncharacterized protein LOC105149213 [Acromyrmex echinatior]